MRKTQLRSTEIHLTVNTIKAGSYTIFGKPSIEVGELKDTIVLDLSQNLKPSYSSFLYDAKYLLRHPNKMVSIDIKDKETIKNLVRHREKGKPLEARLEMIDKLTFSVKGKIKKHEATIYFESIRENHDK